MPSFTIYFHSVKNVIKNTFKIKTKKIIDTKNVCSSILRRWVTSFFLSLVTPGNDKIKKKHSGKKEIPFRVQPC